MDGPKGDSAMANHPVHEFRDQDGMFSRIHRRAGETVEREARNAREIPFLSSLAEMQMRHLHFYNKRIADSCAAPVRGKHTHREFMRHVGVLDFQTFASRSYCAYPKSCDCSFVFSNEEKKSQLDNQPLRYDISLIAQSSFPKFGISAELMLLGIAILQR